MTAATKSASEAAAPEIAIEVNAEPQRVRAGTLADVLVALGYGGQKVATALNGAFVPERMRTETPVASGDRIEILSARQGG
ncbi:MAG: sulfur carrier protein ThiS [Hyphomicrobiaceae bacterium]